MAPPVLVVVSENWFTLANPLPIRNISPTICPASHNNAWLNSEIKANKEDHQCETGLKCKHFKSNMTTILQMNVISSVFMFFAAQFLVKMWKSRLRLPQILSCIFCIQLSCWLLFKKTLVKKNMKGFTTNPIVAKPVSWNKLWSYGICSNFSKSQEMPPSYIVFCHCLLLVSF